MWMAQRSKTDSAQAPTLAEQGVVTLGGDPVGVYLDGERRWLPVYGPGGYCWRPAAGQRVLVLKAGESQEGSCVVGARQQESDLRPGEVVLTGPDGGGLRLEQGGAVRLTGEVYLGERRLEDMIRKIVGEMLSPL